VSIKGDIHKLEPGALIDLLVLDLTPVDVNQTGGVLTYYLYAGSDVDYGPIYFQGQNYDPWPVTVEGFEKRGSAAEKRPKVRISNFNRFVTKKTQQYDDLVGAIVKRRRTFAQYLGGSVADSTKYSEELFFIEQKTNENAIFQEFELSSAMDFVDKRLPGRTAVANACPWQYATTANGSGCSWPRNDPGKYYNAAGVQVFNQQQDVCGKRLADCKLRFGADQPLDFGGFPSLGRN